MKTIEEMPEMSYEAYIPISSRTLIGKTFREIEKEFKVKIDHYHNSPVDITTRHESKPDIVFSPGMTIKVYGDWDKIDKFTEFYKLF